LALHPTQKKLHRLYFGSTPAALRFQGVLLVLDVVLIGFFMIAPFFEKESWFLAVDYVIAVVLAVDLIFRAWAYGDFRKWISRPIVWADIAVLLSLVIPAYLANLGFLRILRAYSLINGQALWRILNKGKWQDTHVADTTRAVANLFVFIFMVTALVHTGFAARVDGLNSYMDSLYFTITSLSTTGYGDIVLPGFWGRLVSIIAMIGGVTLFFRLVQVAFRPAKVRFPCPACGLQRHDLDAVHCKACGTRICIEDEGD
jgi:voltage-gated potassium channel